MDGVGVYLTGAPGVLLGLEEGKDTLRANFHVLVI